VSEIFISEIAFSKFGILGQALYPRQGKKGQQFICYMDEDLGFYQNGEARNLVRGKVTQTGR